MRKAWIAIAAVALAMSVVAAAFMAGAFRGAATGGENENENFVLPENIHSLQAFMRVRTVAEGWPIDFVDVLLVKDIYDNSSVKIARVLNEGVIVSNFEQGKKWWVVLSEEDNEAENWWLEGQNLRLPENLYAVEGGRTGWFGKLRYEELPNWRGENITFAIEKTATSATFTFYGIVLNPDLNDNLFEPPFPGYSHYYTILMDEFSRIFP